MGISLEQIRKLNCVTIISQIDDAVDNEKTDWEAFDEDPIANLSKIVYKPQKAPTLFICNFEFTAAEAAKEKDAMIGGMDEEKNPKTALGKWAYTVAKMSLKEIKNPADLKTGIKLKKDSYGYVSEDTMNMLERLGIVSEIFKHFLTLSKTDVRKNAKN